MVRLTRPDSTGQALPVWPDAATPSLLDEYQVPPVAVERSGETRRVLAATLKCCWSDLSVDPWPGTPAPAELILDTYRALIGRTDDLMRNWAIGALRRLHDSAWIVMSDGVVSLGPRCALWPIESHAQLKELVRRIPAPEPRDLRVVADADIVAAATEGSPVTTATEGPAVATTTEPGGRDHHGDLVVGTTAEDLVVPTTTEDLVVATTAGEPSAATGVQEPQAAVGTATRQVTVAEAPHVTATHERAAAAVTEKPQVASAAQAPPGALDFAMAAGRVEGGAGGVRRAAGRL